MSWKIRRAHYYSRQKGGGIDPEVAKWTNLIFLISLLFSFLFIVLATGDADTDNPIVVIIGLFGLISFVTTPVLFLFFLGGIQYGLPNFSSSQRVKGNQGEDTWDSWIREDKEKKERDFHQENLDKWLEDNKGKKIFNRAEAEKAALTYHKRNKRNSYEEPINKADYLKRRKEIKEQEKKDIKDKIAKYKAESKKYSKEKRNKNNKNN